MNQQGTQFEGAKIDSPGTLSAPVFHSTILKEIRSWAITLLIFGVLHIFASGFLSATWGILLVVVGLASFYFRSSAMMVVYAITLAWAGIGNLTSGQAGWIGFAIFQWFLVFRIFQQFLVFRRAETNSVETDSSSSGLTPKRSESAFPWVAGALGSSSLCGLIAVFAGAIILTAISGSHQIPGFLTFIEGLVVNCGVLGFAVGLASILCKYPRKALAIVGMITGICTLLVEVIFVFI